MGKDTRDALTVLHEFYPARAEQLADVLAEINGDEGVLENWREQQIIKFIKALTLNAEWLERAYQEKQIMPLAWAARNLLELSVWIEYCNLSEAHATRFRDDAARDLLGFSKAIQGLHVDNHGAEHPGLKNTLQDLGVFAQDVLGVSSLDEDFRRVSEAAKETGHFAMFVKVNKIFSKFAHPTSLAMNSVNAIEIDSAMRQMFFNDGVSVATKALTNVRTFMLKHFPLLIEE